MAHFRRTDAVPNDHPTPALRALLPKKALHWMEQPLFACKAAFNAVSMRTI
jgi:hypothetical protein